MQTLQQSPTKVNGPSPAERIQRKAMILQIRWNELCDEAQKAGELGQLNDTLTWMEFYWKGAKSMDDPLNWGIES